MPDPTAEAQTPPKRKQSFLAELVEHGEKQIAADLPTDVRKVLGGLISWIAEGGKFVEPQIFNPAAAQQVAEAEAQQSRLEAQNGELAERLAALEARLTAQAQAAPAPARPAPAAPQASPPGEGVPVVAPPEAEAPPAPPTPPPSV